MAQEREERLLPGFEPLPSIVDPDGVVRIDPDMLPGLTEEQRRAFDVIYDAMTSGVDARTSIASQPAEPVPFQQPVGKGGTDSDLQHYRRVGQIETNPETGEPMIRLSDGQILEYMPTGYARDPRTGDVFAPTQQPRLYRWPQPGEPGYRPYPSGREFPVAGPSLGPAGQELNTAAGIVGMLIEGADPISPIARWDERRRRGLVQSDIATFADALQVAGAATSIPAGVRTVRGPQALAPDVPPQTAEASLPPLPQGITIDIPPGTGPRQINGRVMQGGEEVGNFYVRPLRGPPSGRPIGFNVGRIILDDNVQGQGIYTHLSHRLEQELGLPHLPDATLSNAAYNWWLRRDRAAVEGRYQRADSDTWMLRLRENPFQLTPRMSEVGRRDSGPFVGSGGGSRPVTPRSTDLYDRIEQQLPDVPSASLTGPQLLDALLAPRSRVTEMDIQASNLDRFVLGDRAANIRRDALNTRDQLANFRRMLLRDRVELSRLNQGTEAYRATERSMREAQDAIATASTSLANRVREYQAAITSSTHPPVGRYEILRHIQQERSRIATERSPRALSSPYEAMSNEQLASNLASIMRGYTVQYTPQRGRIGVIGHASDAEFRLVEGSYGNTRSLYVDSLYAHSSPRGTVEAADLLRMMFRVATRNNVTSIVVPDAVSQGSWLWPAIGFQLSSDHLSNTRNLIAKRIGKLEQDGHITQAQRQKVADVLANWNVQGPSRIARMEEPISGRPSLPGIRGSDLTLGRVVMYGIDGGYVMPASRISNLVKVVMSRGRLFSNPDDASGLLAGTAAASASALRDEARGIVRGWRDIYGGPSTQSRPGGLSGRTGRSTTAMENYPRAYDNETLGPTDHHPGPVMAYHGTSVSEPFTVFDLSLSNDIGHHFGTREQANWFTQAGSRYRRSGPVPHLRSSTNTRVIPAYLNIRNPLTLPDLGNWNPRDLMETISNRLTDPTARRRAADMYYDMRHSRIGTIRDEFRAVRDLLDDLGYDSIRYRNSVEGEGWSYIVWKPGLIRSATDPSHQLYARGAPVPQQQEDRRGPSP